MLGLRNAEQTRGFKTKGTVGESERLVADEKLFHLLRRCISVDYTVDKATNACHIQSVTPRFQCSCGRGAARMDGAPAEEADACNWRHAGEVGIGCAGCTLEVLGARHFRYRDGTLEREVWFLDNTATNPDEAFIVLHIHCAILWADWQASNSDSSDELPITQMNIRQSRTRPMQNINGSLQFAANPNTGHAHGQVVDGKGERLGSMQRPTEQVPEFGPLGRWCEGSEHALCLLKCVNPDGTGWRGWAKTDRTKPADQNVRVTALNQGNANWSKHLLPSNKKLWRVVKGGSWADVGWLPPNQAVMPDVIDGQVLVRKAAQALLIMTQGVVKQEIQFRASGGSQGDAGRWFPAPTPSKLKVIGCCFGINNYTADPIRVPKLMHCESGAEEMAKKFSSKEHSHGIAITTSTGHELEQVGDWKKSLKLELFPLLNQNAATLQAVVLYFACHGLQFADEMFLLPAAVRLDFADEEELRNTVTGSCFKLSKLITHVTAEVRSARKKDNNANDGKPCLCIFVLDACRNIPDLAEYSLCKAQKTLHPEGDKDVECLVTYSTRSQGVASDESIYTKALLANLFENGKQLRQVLMEVEGAMKAGPQTPTCHGSEISKELVLFPTPAEPLLTCTQQPARFRPAQLVMSYCTQSSNDAKGGEQLMRRVVNWLEQRGYTTFNGKQCVGDRIQECTAVIPFLSTPFFESKACTRELIFADNKDKFILPLLAEPYGANCPSECEMILQSCTCVPFQGSFVDNFDVNMKQLLSKLEYYKCLPEDKGSSKRSKILEKPVQHLQHLLTSIQQPVGGDSPIAPAPPSKRVLGVFCTDADHNPNIKPELSELARHMGKAPKSTDVALLELMPETAAVHQVGNVQVLWQPTAQTFGDSLVRVEPQVLHLAGHNAQHGGPRLMSIDGITQVDTDTLADMIQASSFESKQLECVVLNFCRSHHLAELLRTKGCKHAVCWEQDTSDKACQLFTESFYRCLARGGTYAQCFEAGRLNVQLCKESVFILDANNKVRCEAAESTWQLDANPKFLSFQPAPGEGTQTPPEGAAQPTVITLQGDCDTPGILPPVVKTFFQKLAKASGEFSGLPDPSSVKFYTEWEGNLSNFPNVQSFIDRFEKNLKKQGVDVQIEGMHKGSIVLLVRGSLQSFVNAQSLKQCQGLVKRSVQLQSVSYVVDSVQAAEQLEQRVQVMLQDLIDLAIHNAVAREIRKQFPNVSTEKSATREAGAFQFCQPEAAAAEVPAEAAPSDTQEEALNNEDLDLWDDGVSVTLVYSNTREYLLKPGVTRVGRAPAKNELVLENPTVSREHIRICWESGSEVVQVSDLGSTFGSSLITNGTSETRQMLPNQVYEMGQGDQLRLGENKAVGEHYEKLQLKVEFKAVGTPSPERQCGIWQLCTSPKQIPTLPCSNQALEGASSEEIPDICRHLGEDVQLANTQSNAAGTEDKVKYLQQDGKELAGTPIQALNDLALPNVTSVTDLKVQIKCKNSDTDVFTTAVFHHERCIDSPRVRYYVVMDNGEECSPQEFETRAGSRSKKWKDSLKVTDGTGRTIYQYLLDEGIEKPKTLGAVTPPASSTTLSTRKRQSRGAIKPVFEPGTHVEVSFKGEDGQVYYAFILEAKMLEPDSNDQIKFRYRVVFQHGDKFWFRRRRCSTICGNKVPHPDFLQIHH